MPSLPKTFSFQRVKSGAVVTILTVEHTLTQADVDPAADLFIYGDTIAIPAELKLPGRKIRIVARRLICGAGSVLDVSGARSPSPAAALPTPEPATPGVAGTAGREGMAGAGGQHSGSVDIVAGAIEGKLSIVAIGNDGQQGQAGQRGGMGGLGADGNDTVIDKKARVILGLPQRGRDGGVGGAGGAGGKAGDGGSGGNISLFAPSSTLVAATCMGGLSGAPGLPGSGGEGGQGGHGGRKYSYKMYDDGTGLDLHKHYFLIGEREADGNKGAAGAAGAAGKRGAAGKDGVVTRAPIPSAKPLANEDRAMAFTQLQLSLQQAKLDYLAADYSSARQILSWIVLLAGDTAGATEWAHLRRTAETLIAQIDQGVDYYGRSMDWVPLVSFEYYRNALTGMLNLGLQIERNYNAYVEAASGQAKTFDAAAAMLQQGDELVAQLEKTRERADQDLAALADAIDQLTSAQAQKERLILAASEAFQLAVQRKSNDCTFVDILSGLKTVVTIGLTVYDTYSAIEKLGALGASKNPADDLVKQVKVVSGSYEDVRTKWKQIAALNTAKSPDAAKLVAEQERFDKLIEGYLALPEAKAYQAIVHDFTGTVQTRNAKVLERTNLAVSRESLAATIALKKSELERLRGDSAAIKDPLLPRFRTYVGNLYADFREHYLRHVYNEHQAYRYWALAPSAPFAVSDRSIDGLAAYHAQLQTKTIEAIQGVLSPKQPFHQLGFSIVMPKDPTLPDPFRDLRATGRMTVQVPPGIRAFQGFAEVAATTFSIFLRGAKPSDGATVYCRLWHQGRGAFFDPSGKRHDFSHEAVMSMYVYELDAGGQAIYKAGGNLGGGERIGLSPFATWTIELPPKFNEGLDLGGLTEVTIAFSGRAVPSAPDRARFASVAGESTERRLEYHVI